MAGPSPVPCPDAGVHCHRCNHALRVLVGGTYRFRRKSRGGGLMTLVYGRVGGSCVT